MKKGESELENLTLEVQTEILISKSKRRYMFQLNGRRAWEKEALIGNEEIEKEVNWRGEERTSYKDRERKN